MIKLKLTALCLPWSYLTVLNILVLILLIETHALERIHNFFSPNFTWKISTGLVLLLLVSFQWCLTITRYKNSTISSIFYKYHRYAGIIIPFFLGLHFFNYGFAWNAMLFTVFVTNIILGLLNRELFRYRNKALYWCWYALHIGLSFLLLPLIILHVWTSLTFE